LGANHAQGQDGDFARSQMGAGDEVYLNTGQLPVSDAEITNLIDVDTRGKDIPRRASTSTMILFSALLLVAFSMGTDIHTFWMMIIAC
jgi:hypothetical protein